MTNKRMEGKRALVTGAGTGIGRGVGLELAKEGAAVVFHYSQSAAGAESAVEEVLKAGGKAKAIWADFNKVEPVKELGKEAIDFLGGIDILVNNAGITVNMPFEEVTPEVFDTLYHVNIRAQYFLTQTVVPTMEKQGKGVVINITSVHAFSGMTEHSVYAGTKGAIVAYTRELALELIQKGIRVNAIAPGGVWTEKHERLIGKEFKEALQKQLPAGFIAVPEDIGKFVLFLASDDSRYVIGQTMICDGGQSAIMPLTGDFRERRKERWGREYIPS